MAKGDYAPLKMQDGLKVFLDKTKDRHNGRDWNDLDAFIKQGLNISNIGRAFNLKSWQAAKDMIEQYKKEQDASTIIG